VGHKKAEDYTRTTRHRRPAVSRFKLPDPCRRPCTEVDASLDERLYASGGKVIGIGYFYLLHHIIKSLATEIRTSIFLNMLVLRQEHGRE
jgi:hypothetical protein